METVIGFLEIHEKGYGFLRDIQNNFDQDTDDTFVPPNLIKSFKLKEGVMIQGKGGPGNKSTNLQLVEIEKINNSPAKEYLEIVPFHDKISIDPCDRLKLTQNESDKTGMALDLIVPMGKGQRGLIVAPPKTGKTSILKHMAESITKNHPEMIVFVLLVDERPEEVTAFKRELKNVFVISSSSDQSLSQHLRVTRLTMNSAMRCAETGYDAIVLIDSLTRMSRAFNAKTDSFGKTLSGGLGARSLQIPRRYFGSARNFEGKGSLTNIATILVDTGSRMDEIIFQEFKGTGNMDLLLSRKCAEKRVWPAINIKGSGTRKEHLIMNKKELKRIVEIRRNLANLDETEAMKVFLESL